MITSIVLTVACLALAGTSVAIYRTPETVSVTSTTSCIAYNQVNVFYTTTWSYTLGGCQPEIFTITHTPNQQACGVYFLCTTKIQNYTTTTTVTHS